ncbi:hypothetical protein LTS18_007545 [Coniosporium uncinatum]|uniref:Uncharacterized protein n=1 Tax=Coniosporium uncinatum TaxID=93489 RepID=A0ACC3DAD2_9PEZI|nr:hypothetical protein LTS18_007545 [Coniosporium uncinatum]
MEAKGAEVHGAAHQDHEAEVKDLGWHKPEEQIPSPLVGRLPNENLWLLLRRFNKQMYHVKEVTVPVPGGLDLNIANEEEFSPDKLRANIERFYTTVIIGLMGFGKHIVRLRSWRETRLLIALIAYPPSRPFLFPPAPLALVDGKTGGVQKPKAGVLGSLDSATGAPENMKGEAVEQEASNFVNGIASVALSSATGKHQQTDASSGEEGSPDDSVPDPTAITMAAATARKKANGGNATAHHDKTKVPMENAMWTRMRPIMHGIADVSDTWERFANALSPTPPFPHDAYRLRLAALIVAMLGASFFISSYTLVKGTTFGTGFGFFGDPVIQRGLEYLNKHYPKWQKLLELRSTVLKGVPTNAQLTVTLLRIGEANKGPLLPVPRHHEPPPEEPAEVTDEHLRATGADWPLNATQEELNDAMAHDPQVPHQTGGDDINASKEHKHGKKGSRLLSFFKHTAKGAVETAIGADKLKAKVGSEHAKNRLGVIPETNDDPLSGPVDFKSRYHGKKGHVYISAKATIPCVFFSTDSTIEKIGSMEREDLHPIWSIPVGDIRELKKVGGYGWKAKLVMGWALDKEIADGIEIVDRRGSTWLITAMPLRNELFNRLCAMGGQKWEAW